VISPEEKALYRFKIINKKEGVYFGKIFYQNTAENNGTFA